MRRTLVPVLVVLAALAVIAAPAASFAQAAGTVSGTVADETGGVLPGVNVELRPPAPRSRSKP